jgi:hypothetical protein
MKTNERRRDANGEPLDPGNDSALASFEFAIDAAQKTYLPSIFDRASRLRLAQPSFST